MLMIGNSGSGKNTTLFNLLLNKQFPYVKNFKDTIWIISPTLKQETRWKYVGLPEEQTSEGEDIDEFVENVKEHQEANGYKPCLIILYDIIPMLSSSKTSGVVKLFISGRHHNINSVILSQGYRQAIPKIVRLQATSLIIYKVNKKELLAIYEERPMEAAILIES